VKDTSLARIIALREIIMEAYSFVAKGLIVPLFYSGLFFLAFTGILQILFGKIEKKLDYFK
ncbi:MAG: amino acid ABC transporter permease, partial [Oscillospiraceae bacterium]|nr:amino acid ABC transporter permease [Oscillospiraceae bacterium]